MTKDVKKILGPEGQVVEMNFRVSQARRSFFRKAAKTCGSTLKEWVIVNLIPLAEEVNGESYQSFLKTFVPENKTVTKPKRIVSESDIITALKAIGEEQHD